KFPKLVHCQEYDTNSVISMDENNSTLYSFINAILADVPEERNTLLFSATMSPEIAQKNLSHIPWIGSMHF
ncbi:hypothetical protein D0T60_18885, partial [Bacteroides sp. 224]